MRFEIKQRKLLFLQGRGNLNHEKAEFAHEHPHLKTLEEVVETIKPTAIIGEITGNAGKIKRIVSPVV